LIYSGGGNFYLLVHASDQQKLDALRERISRILWAASARRTVSCIGIPAPKKKLISLKAKSPNVGMI